MLKILVAEDEVNIRKLISKTLENAGYSVVECCDGKIALEQFHSQHIDLVVTDVMMPNMDGNTLSSHIRKSNKDVPILILTALASIDDKEKGFNSGTDDYMTKPIIMKELILRVKALLRRYKINSDNKIELPNTILNFNTNTVKVNNADVELSKKEFLLLFKLLASPNIIYSREQLLDEIWGYDSESGDRTVDTHIKWLRDKVVSKDFEIVTVRGLGYKAVIK